MIWDALACELAEDLARLGAERLHLLAGRFPDGEGASG
tara:strand:- start:9 stop:122 length:114 start_codon:yes stop_codon:yes gene_type:complete